jgi:tetratricopeptide (TPR) repeat protein
MKSEISEGRRIDLDEDEENLFDYKNNGILYLILGKRDPQNKSFNFSYEIQLYGQYDFIFDFKGEMSKEEFNSKTKKIRQYPYHLKYTLFQSEELKMLRRKEFAFLFFKFDELKEKGNKMYKRGKFRESIDFYIRAYSILKWIEFKEPKQIAYIVGNEIDGVSKEALEKADVIVELPMLGAKVRN